MKFLILCMIVISSLSVFAERCTDDYIDHVNYLIKDKTCWKPESVLSEVVDKTNDKVLSARHVSVIENDNSKTVYVAIDTETKGYTFYYKQTSDEHDYYCKVISCHIFSVKN